MSRTNTLRTDTDSCIEQDSIDVSHTKKDHISMSRIDMSRINTNIPLTKAMINIVQ